MTNLHCPTCGSRVFSIHPLVSEGICSDLFHVKPKMPTKEERVQAYTKLTEQGIMYVPPGLPKEDYTYAVEEEPIEGGYMAVIRRDEPVSSEEEISEETNELVKEDGARFFPGIAETNPTEEEEVTQNDEDENPEQHIGQPVDYDLGEDDEPNPNKLPEEVEAKSQNRTSDGRFSS